MYEDAFNACYHDNKDVCTAFTSWGFNDKYTWLDENRVGYEVWPLYFTDNYEKKPAYNAVLNAIEEPHSPKIYDASELMFSKLANDPDKGECSGCEGDVGTCRLSWPLNDPLRFKSSEKAWRCQINYSYGAQCGNPNKGYCEDWCNDCRWSWPATDSLAWNSEQAACRCEPRGIEYTFSKKLEKTNLGLCDGCEDCYRSWPEADPANWKSVYSIQRCKSKIEDPDIFEWKTYCWDTNKGECDGCQECRWSWLYEEHELQWNAPSKDCRCKPE